MKTLLTTLALLLATTSAMAAPAPSTCEINMPNETTAPAPELKEAASTPAVTEEVVSTNLYEDAEKAVPAVAGNEKVMEPSGATETITTELATDKAPDRTADLEAKLAAETSARAELEAKLAAETLARAELDARLAKIDAEHAEKLAAEKAETRKQAFEKAFDRVRIKPAYRELVLPKFADVDPASQAGEKAIDDFVKAFPDIIDKTEVTPAAPKDTDLNAAHKAEKAGTAWDFLSAEFLAQMED